MWRFILKENIRNFRNQLAAETSAGKRAILRQLLTETEIELAELEDASTSELARDDAAVRIIAERAIERAMQLQGAQFGTLQLYDEGRARLVIVAQKNFRAAFLRPFLLTRPGDGSVSGRCFEEGQTIAVENVDADPIYAERRGTAREGGYKALLCSPVRSSSGKIFGVLATQFTDARSFTPDDLTRLERHADSVGRELERRIADRSTTADVKIPYSTRG